MHVHNDIVAAERDAENWLTRADKVAVEDSRRENRIGSIEEELN
jgi:hypothetical protein